MFGRKLALPTSPTSRTPKSSSLSPTNPLGPGRRGNTNVSVDSDTGSSSGSQSFTRIPTLSASPPSALLTSPSAPAAQSHDQDAGDSNNEVASSDYAKKCKALMELYRALRSLGADMFFELPKIAVIRCSIGGKKLSHRSSVWDQRS
ncbi:hypothetical protein BT96DRAFT_675520 [Gymnopus androsaceus JB14]|uniref:Uncharacterized protein n=1 Tax=Gymnopus androsaceus JB14 TaxID=1447944 RepID=A0A6A4HS65_9AGAR|nr:hypothetical protein BT96DRAFT_675520 [Gymnopus androsaceus JB14]